jgi:hypothetical protein
LFCKQKPHREFVACQLITAEPMFSKPSKIAAAKAKFEQALQDGAVHGVVNRQEFVFAEFCSPSSMSAPASSSRPSRLRRMPERLWRRQDDNRTAHRLGLPVCADE